VVSFFRIAVAFQQQEQGAVPRCLTGFVDAGETILDVVPDLCPERLGRYCKGIRVLIAQCRAVRVIVEKVNVRTPSEPHLEP
jgi:hypothetical protein